MANIAPQITRLNTFKDDCHVVLWETLTETNNTGDPIEMPGSAVRSVQLIGTVGGSTVIIEGSNDGVNYATLTDPQGNAISKTTLGVIETIEEVTRFIRPRISGGTGVDVDVHLLVRR